MPINDDLRETALEFVGILGSNTSDSITLGYMDNIEADLNDITDKNVAYIRTNWGANESSFVFNLVPFLWMYL